MANPCARARTRDRQTFMMGGKHEDVATGEKRCGLVTTDPAGEADPVTNAALLRFLCEAVDFAISSHRRYPVMARQSVR